jgi:hypothetical protein
MPYEHTWGYRPYPTGDGLRERYTSRKAPGAWEEIQVPEAEWPGCAVCGRRVDGFAVDVRAGFVIFAAVCHGATEVIQVPAADLEDTVGDFQFGLAFTGPLYEV